MWRSLRCGPLDVFTMKKDLGIVTAIKEIMVCFLEAATTGSFTGRNPKRQIKTGAVNQIWLWEPLSCHWGSQILCFRFQAHPDAVLSKKQLVNKANSLQNKSHVRLRRGVNNFPNTTERWRKKRDRKLPPFQKHSLIFYSYLSSDTHTHTHSVYMEAFFWRLIIPRCTPLKCLFSWSPLSLWEW